MTITEQGPQVSTDEPDDFGTPPMVDVTPETRPDSKPRRPTTRAARKAAAEARKAAGASNDSKPKVTKTAPRKASLENRLAGALVGMGTMLTAAAAVTGSEALGADGVVVIQHSANLAAAINKAADQDPRVKAALEKMLTAGVWSGVAMAVVPVALAIAGNHGAIPPQLAAMLSGPQPGMPSEQAAA